MMDNLPKMNEFIGKNVLITTDNWFYGPDAKSYRAVYGKLKNIKAAENLLGVKPGRTEATWYIEIGNIVIAGCQVKYAIQTDKCDTLSDGCGWSSDAQHGCKTYSTPNPIYFAGE